MSVIGDLFNLVLINPLTNLFVLLSTLTGNAGFGVILLTFIIIAATLPLRLKQMQSTRAMAALAPRMQEVQRKYKDPKRRSEEQMKLYREMGINPLGCFSSMLLQFPILIALYQVFSVAIGDVPEALIKVQSRLYDWQYLRDGFPIPADFLGLHLGRPNAIAIPILVAGTTFLLQKMTMMPATDEKQRAQNSMMNLMMPLIFGYITMTLPSGLGLYYVLSNIIGVIIQYVYVGGGPINWRGLVGLSQDAVLPRALEIRTAQNEKVRNLGGDDEPEPGVAVKRPNPKRPSPQNGQTPEGADRRRRYTSGRRRSRR